MSACKCFVIYFIFIVIVWLAFMRIKVAPIPPSSIARQCSNKYFAYAYIYVYVCICDLLFRTLRVCKSPRYIGVNINVFARVCTLTNRTNHIRKSNTHVHTAN